MVQQVHFTELKATFEVTGVEDDGVHLPTRHEVALIDLLPTKFQENSAIEIETTAKCVDMLRYITNILLPQLDTINQPTGTFTNTSGCHGTTRTTRNKTGVTSI